MPAGREGTLGRYYLFSAGGMKKNMKIQFNAEIIEVKAKKTASVDKEISIRLVTDNEEALKLQSAIANESVKVSVEVGE